MSALKSEASRIPKWVYVLELAAIGWSIALVPVAVLIPSDTSYSVSTYVNGHLAIHHVIRHTTLLQVNGVIVLVPAALCIFGTVLVLSGTLLVSQGVQLRMDIIGLVAAGAIAVVGVLGLLTIGLIVLPVSVMLGVAGVNVGESTGQNRVARQ